MPPDPCPSLSSAFSTSFSTKEKIERNQTKNIFTTLVIAVRHIGQPFPSFLRVLPLEGEIESAFSKKCSIRAHTSRSRGLRGRMGRAEHRQWHRSRRRTRMLARTYCSLCSPRAGRASLSRPIHSPFDRFPPPLPHLRWLSAQVDVGGRAGVVLLLMHLEGLIGSDGKTTTDVLRRCCAGIRLRIGRPVMGLVTPCMF